MSRSGPADQAADGTDDGAEDAEFDGGDEYAPQRAERVIEAGDSPVVVRKLRRHVVKEKPVVGHERGPADTSRDDRVHPDRKTHRGGNKDAREPGSAPHIRVRREHGGGHAGSLRRQPHLGFGQDRQACDHPGQQKRHH